MGRYLAVKIETKPDTNGNSRRGWLTYHAPDAFHGVGGCLAFIDAEGQTGDHPLMAIYGERDQDWYTLCVLEVTPREWRIAKANQRERDVPHLRVHGSACKCHYLDLEWEQV
jgi:hypothetical protein